MKHILILEDDFSYRKMLAAKLSSYGRIFEAETLPQAYKILEAGHLDFALVDLDLDEPLAGLNFLAEAQKSKQIDSVVLSSHDEEDVIEKAFELGATQFLNKWDFDSYLKECLHEQLSSRKNLQTNHYYKTKDEDLLLALEENIQLFLKTKQQLLITGETGVGKGVLAKSLAGKNPFVHVNLSEFSSGTIESELFGHKKGAFTGANNDKAGLLQKADGGILFLDEIGTLTLELQKKLLRVIEEKEFYPVGSSQIERSNFRLVSATCDDLKGLIKKGVFRKDFFYRISGLEVEIPPLRDRKCDIEQLVIDINKKSPKKIFFSDEAKEKFVNYSWPGNYRELISFLDKLKGTAIGKITLQQVEGLLKEEHKAEDILSYSMKGLIEKKGLGFLVNKLESEAFEWAKDRASGGVNESMRILKISKSLLYRIQKQSIVNNAN